MRSWPALLLLAAGCGPGSDRAGAADWPRLAPEAGADALVWEAVQEALAACERGDPGAPLVLAEVYDANELPELARQGYERVLARGAGDEEARVQLLLAGVLERTGRPEEALTHLERAARLDPAYVPTHWKRGGLLLELGRLAEARAAFELALEREPLGVMQRLGKARLELLAGRPEEALATLEPLAERAPRVRFVHGLMARALRALGREAEAALELRREARANEIGVVDPWTGRMQARATGLATELERANAALLEGNTQAALERLESLEPRFPHDLALARMRIRLRLALGDAEGAWREIEAVRARAPENFELELLAGRALAARGAPREALAALRRSCALNPAFGAAWADRGEVEFQLGLLAEAEASLGRALESGTDDPRTRLLLGRTQLARRGQDPRALARALETFEECCREFPRSAPALAHLAEAQALAGDTAAARRSLEQAQRFDPDVERLTEIGALLDAREAGR